VSAGANGKHLRLEVAGTPDPFLLRAAIAARVEGRPWPVGPERTIADAVAAATAPGSAGAGTSEEPREPWR